MKKAVIILSGGLDSACMMSYLKKGYQLYGITFAYGQRASEEIKAAKRIAKLLKLKEHKILDRHITGLHNLHQLDRFVGCHCFAKKVFVE